MMVWELEGEQLMRAFTSMAQRLSNLNQVLVDRAVTFTEYNAGLLSCNLHSGCRLVTLTTKIHANVGTLSVRALRSHLTLRIFNTPILIQPTVSASESNIGCCHYRKEGR